MMAAQRRNDPAGYPAARRVVMRADDATSDDDAAELTRLIRGYQFTQAL
jgi:hypothetical protein